MAWMHCSLHGQQYQSCQLFIHWSVRLVVPHTEHLGRSSGAGLLTVSQMPKTRSPMKMRTTIPIMTPLQCNDFHVGRVTFAVAVPVDGAGEPERPARFDLVERQLRSRHVSHLSATRIHLRMELARAYVIKASGHPRFPRAGVEHCLVPRSGSFSPVVRSQVSERFAKQIKEAGDAHMPIWLMRYTRRRRGPTFAARGEPFSGAWPRLRQTMAAVGHHYRPSDERGRLVGEKEHARGDLLRRATAPDRSRRCGGGFER